MLADEAVVAGFANVLVDRLRLSYRVNPLVATAIPIANDGAPGRFDRVIAFTVDSRAG